MVSGIESSWGVVKQLKTGEAQFVESIFDLESLRLQMGAAVIQPYGSWGQIL